MNRNIHKPHGFWWFLRLITDGCLFWASETRESREAPTEKAGLLRRGCEARLRQMPQGRRLGMGCDIHVTFMWLHGCRMFRWFSWFEAAGQPYISHYAFPICCGMRDIVRPSGWRWTVRRKVLGCSTWSSPHQRPQGRPDVLLWFPAAAAAFRLQDYMDQDTGSEGCEPQRCR